MKQFESDFKSYVNNDLVQWMYNIKVIYTEQLIFVMLLFYYMVTWNHSHYTKYNFCQVINRSQSVLFIVPTLSAYDKLLILKLLYINGSSSGNHMVIWGN